MTDDIEQRLRKMLNTRADAVTVPARAVEFGRRRWVQAVVPLGLAAAVAAAVIATSTLVPPGAEVGPGSPAAPDCSTLIPSAIVQMGGTVQVWSASSSPDGSSMTVSARSQTPSPEPEESGLDARASATPLESGSTAPSSVSGSFRVARSTGPDADTSWPVSSSEVPVESDDSDTRSSPALSQAAAEVPVDPCGGTDGGRGWVVTCDDEGRLSSQSFSVGAESERRSSEAVSTRSPRPTEAMRGTTAHEAPASSSGAPIGTNGPGWVSVDCRGSGSSSTG